MRVIITAGGTGGHIYPALAIINKIKEKEPNSEFLYIGTHNRMEKEIIPEKKIPFESIEIYGVQKKVWKNVNVAFCFVKAYKKCKRLIKQFRPDIVIGAGGYVTGPVIYAASHLGYPTFIHEQNSIPGKANLFLARYATKIGVSFPSTVTKFPKEKTVYTGNPCSEEAVKKAPLPKETFHLKENKKLVLIVMGSLGSSKMNQFFSSFLQNVGKKDYEVLWVTGKQDYETLKKETYPKNVVLTAYIPDLTRILKNTDLIVSRAGASTLSEIIALKIPAILIPSPYVPNNHQVKNAEDLVQKKAAMMIEEKDLDEQTLLLAIEDMLKNKQKYIKNLNSFEVTNSALKIYEVLRDIIDRK